MPKFSIVTVTWNSAKTLEETILSVRAQRGAEVEHIIIDGGSTDGTLDIIGKYRDVLGPVISEKDKGIYDAMNKGLALASGEFTGFLNSDDYFYSPDAIANVAGRLDQTGADCIWGDVVFIDEERRPRRYLTGSLFQPWMFRFGVALPHPSFYARTAHLRAVGGFAAQYKIAGDFDLMLKLLARPGLRTAALRQIVAVMRIGGVSTADLNATRTATHEIADALERNGKSGPAFFLQMRYGLKALEIIRGRLQRWRGISYPAPRGGIDG